ncbi:MAG: ribonuclease T2 [Pseudorhodoplanes sp.]|nr:MAG: ribonuclease T2 [Pseudorhodoplanes sp.]
MIRSTRISPAITISSAIAISSRRAGVCVFSLRVLVTALVLAIFSNEARAQEGRRHEPGRFDFYVLALSWSPSYCEAATERSPDRIPQQQCGARPYHFVVHGLWPQYERGYPRDCQIPAPRLNRAIMSSMLDLMPSPRLVFNQWDRHGTCTGLGPRDYFDAVRKAHGAMTIPEQFREVKTHLSVTPEEVEAAFVTSNPGLSRQAVAVTCDSRRLSEVRICMTKEFRFRDCPEVERRACARDKVVMPPARGGS